MRKLAIAAVLLGVFVSFRVAADQQLLLVPGLRLWGAEGAVGLSEWDIAPPLDTILWAYLSGTWETNGYFRNPNGTLYSGVGDPNAPTDPSTGSPVDPSSAPYYSQWNFRWRFGLEQGLINNPKLPQNLLSAFAFFRGEVNLKQNDPNALQLIYYPDNGYPAAGSTAPVHAAAVNNLRNSLLVGTRIDTLTFDKLYKTRAGVRLEASYEWAPPWLLNDRLGSADFSRVNFNAIGYWPVIEYSADGRRNAFSMYVAEYFAADYLYGNVIPFEARASIGGISPIDGLGGAVRGFEAGRFDTNLKLVNNLEARASLGPVLFPNVVPGFIAFVDTGYFACAYGAPSPWSTNGFISSAGAGITLDAFDLTTVCLYTEYLIVGTRVTGSHWLPVDLEFSFHF